MRWTESHRDHGIGVIAPEHMMTFSLNEFFALYFELLRSGYRPEYVCGETRKEEGKNQNQFFDNQMQFVHSN